MSLAIAACFTAAGGVAVAAGGVAVAATAPRGPDAIREPMQSGKPSKSGEFQRPTGATMNPTAIKVDLSA